MSARGAAAKVKRVRTTKSLSPTAAKPPTLGAQLAEAREQQAATAEILRVISSSPTDVQPVFETIAASALRLCDARFSTCCKYDGELIHLAVLHHAKPEGVAAFHAVYPSPPSRGGITQRAILTGEVVHVADVLKDPEYVYHDAAKTNNYRSVLSVPLLRRGQTIGAITVFREIPAPFPDPQVALLKTFADQALIAIENVRLFTELAQRNSALTESLEQQTSTSEILCVISQSPTDVQPVFDTIATAALTLCNATSANVFTFDGELVHVACLANADPDGPEAIRKVYPRPPGRDSAATRAILTRSVVVIPDVLADRDYATLVPGFRSALAVPLIRESQPIGAIVVGRAEAGAFPEKQVALLQTFADQAVIAIENVRLFTELGVRNRDLSESLEQQTATSEILQVISSSHTELQPVFDTIVRNAARLCDGMFANVLRYDGELLHFTATSQTRPELLALIKNRYPMRPDKSQVAGRVIRDRSVIVMEDALADPDYEHSIAITGHWRRMLGVPMMREGKPIGVIVVGWGEPGSVPKVYRQLLKTFADQAVIAIENVRLFTELEQRNRALAESLEQQTATSEILRVISQSPTDVQPVFDTIAAAAQKMCDAASANVFTFDGDLIHMVALANFNSNAAAAMREVFPRKPGRDTAVTRAILTCDVVAIPDVLSDTEYAIGAAAMAGGFRSTVSVPLIRDGNPIGAISVGRQEPGPFPANQIALLQTFADQAVIAIENVRLFTELGVRNRDLSEALEQQTATSEILRVISGSPTDLQPVLDAVVESAARLCGAYDAILRRVDGEALRQVAHFGPLPEREGPDIHSINSDTVGSRAFLERRTIHVEDVLDEFRRGNYLDGRALQGPIGYRTVLAAPLLREDSAIGVILIRRMEVQPFSDRQVALLQTFADQAVIAIENVRLFTELDARTTDLSRSVGELKALGEVGQAVSSTLDLETVLRTIVSRAAQLAGMDGGSIWEYDETGEQFYLHATDRLPDELVEALRSRPIRKGEGPLGRLAASGEAVQIRDVVDEHSYPSRVREILIRRGFRSVLAVPLLREDHLLGALAVNRSRAGEFAPHVIDLLKTFATQSALAIQNARLFREIEIKSGELETASRHKSEFLANMSHELRTPLNAIIGFSEVLSEQMFGAINDKQAEYLKDILDSGRHLLSLINDILDLSKIEAGRMELEPAEFDLPAAIENALILVRERANRHGITLAHSVDEQLGLIRADERKVKQVLLNLLTNALKFTPEGGRIDVRARMQNGAAEISVSDTGIGIAPEDQSKVFEEFRQVGAASKKIEGTGLGLAISRKFIELHGGTIGVTSKPGVGSTFAFTLPLPRDSHHPG